jgi:hypothetical protein
VLEILLLAHSLAVDSRPSGVTGRVDRLLIAAGLSYVEALRTPQGFKSPPGAADNERSVSPSSRER